MNSQSLNSFRKPFTPTDIVCILLPAIPNRIITEAAVAASSTEAVIAASSLSMNSQPLNSFRKPFIPTDIVYISLPTFLNPVITEAAVAASSTNVSHCVLNHASVEAAVSASNSSINSPTFLKSFGKPFIPADVICTSSLVPSNSTPSSVVAAPGLALVDPSYFTTSFISSTAVATPLTLSTIESVYSLANSTKKCSLQLLLESARRNDPLTANAFLQSCTPLVSTSSLVGNICVPLVKELVISSVIEFSNVPSNIELMVSNEVAAPVIVVVDTATTDSILLPVISSDDSSPEVPTDLLCSMDISDNEQKEYFKNPAAPSIQATCVVAEEKVVVTNNPRLPIRLAINTTLLYRIPKTTESFALLKTLVNIFGVKNIYFFNALQSGDLTQKQTREILTEFEIPLVNFMETNGHDAEVMDKARITHLIDNRHRILLKMQTIAGYIRRCYCVTFSIDKVHSRSLNVLLFNNWVLAIQALIDGLKVPLVRFDSTECWSCQNEDCQGECCVSNPEQLSAFMIASAISEGKIVVVSWNVRSLKNCYLVGNFSSFLKNTEAHFIFLQEVSASTSTIVGLPGFTSLLQQCGFRYCYWYPCKAKPHYSGTALLARIKPDLVIKGLLGTEEGDQTPNLEGRTITAVYGKKIFVAAYFPTLTFKDQCQEMKVAKRQNYQVQYQRHLEHPIFRGKDVILTGDFNTTRTDDDLTFNRRYVKNVPDDFPSTTPLEREFFENLLVQFSLVDAAKCLNGDARYTFFGSHREFISLRMRLDYFLIPSKFYGGQSETLFSTFKVLAQYSGSDHYPIELQLTSGISEHLLKSISVDNGDRSITENVFSIEDIDKVYVNEDVFKPKCWSVTRKHLGFTCDQREKCLYTHDCVCGSEDCSGNCEEMVQFLSICDNNKVRKKIITAVCSENDSFLPYHNVSAVDLLCGEMFQQVTLLQEPIHRFTEVTLFEGVMSTLLSLGLSIETDTAKDVIPDVETIATSFSAIQLDDDNSVKVATVAPEVVSVTNATEVPVISRVVSIKDIAVTDLESLELSKKKPTLADEDGMMDDIVVNDDGESKHESVSDPPVNTADSTDHVLGSIIALQELFSKMDPNNFDVSPSLRDALLYIPTTLTSPLGKTQSLLLQIEELEFRKAEIPKQLSHELWRAIQTLYYIHSKYNDVTRSFVHSPRYTGSWDTLTEEDYSQFQTYYYAVRNISKTMKQLMFDNKLCDQAVIQVIRQHYVPEAVVTVVHLEDDRTEEREEIDQLSSLSNPRRKIFCPHVKVQVTNAPEPILSLVDTGATYCIITSKYLRSIMSSEEISRKSIKTRIKLLVANGQVTKPLQKIMLEFKIGNSTFENEFFIMDVDASYQLILGCSFLNTRDVQLNFRDQSLTIPYANDVCTIGSVDKIEWILLLRSQY